MLRPTGPGGCTAVVRETSFLVIGDGEAYAVGRTGLALGEAGSWVVDDGYRPVAAGTYKLEWERDGGLLVVSGSGTDPVVRGGMTDIDDADGETGHRRKPQLTAPDQTSYHPSLDLRQDG